DALELDDVCAVGRALARQSIDAGLEDARIAAGIDLEALLEVACAEFPGARIEFELDLAGEEHVAVLVAEHGHEHLVAQLWRHGSPVDVEIRGVVRGLTVLEHRSEE